MKSRILGLNYLSSMKALLLLVGFFLTYQLPGQTDPALLEEQVKSESGFEKLSTLNELTTAYHTSNARKSRRYARQAYLLAENFRKSETTLSSDQITLVVKALNFFGSSQFSRTNYLDAKSIFQTSEQLALSAGMQEEAGFANEHIRKIDSLADGTIKDNFFTRKLADINIGNVVSNTNNSVGVALELKMARVNENKGDTLRSIEHYQKAADLLKDRGEFERAEEIETKIESYRGLNALDGQLAGLGIQTLIDTDEALEPIIAPVDSVVKLEQAEASALLDQAQNLEESQDFEAALAYYKRYTTLQRKWEKDSLEQNAQRAMVLLEMDRLRQQNEIADLNITAIQLEKEAEVRLRNALYIGLGAIGIAAIVVLALYISKRKKHRQLSTAYEDLDLAKEELQDAKHHISKLLEQQVSPEIASALIEDAPEKKKQFVAIMFLDIRGFTPIAEKLEPKELIDYQNNIFGFMIEIIQKYHGNINQFMGDGFMATFGAPKSHGNDVRNAFLAGKEIVEQLELTNEKGIIPTTKIGIGIHAGEVVTGNVGTETRKQFSVTGNTVIIAARIEQLNKSYSSNLIVSSDVIEHLEQEDLNEMEYNPYETKVKGRSKPVQIMVFNEERVEA